VGKKSKESKNIPELTGTSLKVYRFIYKQSRPVGIHDVQRGVGLSSSSVASYHVKKLLDEGLLRQEGSGYIVDRIVFENMIRIGQSLIPYQVGFTSFFATTLVLLLTVFRPVQIQAAYFFNLTVNVAALVMFAYETLRARRLFK
jgi:predicted DNA-binding transcriptional regulator